MLVAVIDSIASRHALRWAYERAAVSGAELHVVTAVNPPLPVGSPSVMAIYPIDRHELVESGMAMQCRLVDEAIPDRATAPPITTTVRLGEPFRVLREESGSADLVVLGAPRHPRFRSLPRRCLKHLECPVVVIDDDRPC